MNDLLLRYLGCYETEEDQHYHLFPRYLTIYYYLVVWACVVVVATFVTLNLLTVSVYEMPLIFSYLKMRTCVYYVVEKMISETGDLYVDQIYLAGLEYLTQTPAALSRLREVGRLGFVDAVGSAFRMQVVDRAR